MIETPFDYILCGEKYLCGSQSRASDIPINYKAPKRRIKWSWFRLPCMLWHIFTFYLPTLHAWLLCREVFFAPLATRFADERLPKCCGNLIFCSARCVADRANVNNTLAGLCRDKAHASEKNKLCSSSDSRKDFYSKWWHDDDACGLRNPPVNKTKPGRTASSPKKGKIFFFFSFELATQAESERRRKISGNLRMSAPNRHLMSYDDWRCFVYSDSCDPPTYIAMVVGASTSWIQRNFWQSVRFEFKHH